MQRQGENKLRADAFRTDHIDIFLMGLDDFFYDDQPQARALFIFSAGNIRFIKPLPDFSKAFFWNADAPVFYRSKDFFVLYRCFNRNNGVGV